MKFLFEHFMNETDFPIPRLVSFFNEFERMYVFYEGLLDYLDINNEIEDPDYVWVADQDLRVWGELPPILPTNDLDDDSTENE